MLQENGTCCKNTFSMMSISWIDVNARHKGTRSATEYCYNSYNNYYYHFNSESSLLWKSNSDNTFINVYNYVNKSIMIERCYNRYKKKTKKTVLQICTQ